MQVFDYSFFLFVEIDGCDPEVCAARVNNDYTFVRGDISPNLDIRGNHIEGAFFARQPPLHLGQKRVNHQVDIDIEVIHLIFSKKAGDITLYCFHF